MAPQNLVQSLFEREVGGGVSVREGRLPASVAERERGLYEWATHDSLRHCASECCSLSDAYPRSTIAVAISPDGNLSASTHGDHTVKIIDFNTGKFVRALEGHHRTPWTVRFHPINCSMVVSGSLDFEVRVWDVDTGKCLQSKDFGSPISSLCFHPSGDILAVAGGDKLHLWEYDHVNGRFGKASVVLKTTETIRTVHFHPLGAPLIMTTERVEPKSIQDSSDTAAAVGASRSGGRRFENGTNSSHPQSWYPGDQAAPSGNMFGVQPPPVLFPYPYNGPVFNRASQEILSLGNQSNHGDGRPPTEPLNFWGPGWLGQNPHVQGRGGYMAPQGIMGQFPNGPHGLQPMQPLPRIPTIQPAPIIMPVQPAGPLWPGYGGDDRRPQNDMMSSTEIMTLAGQFRGLRFGPPPSNPGGRRYSSDMDRQGWWPGSRPPQNRHQSVDEAAMRRDSEWQQVTLSLNPDRPPRADLLQSHPRSWPNRRGNHHRRRGSRGSYGGFPYPHHEQDHFVIPEIPLIPPGRGGGHAEPPPAALELVPTEGASEVPLITHTALTRISQIFASLPNFNSQELPCTTRLTMWKFDRDNPHNDLNEPLLQIPGTVLCSEMGAHMSSCGRFLAVCTASLESNSKMGYSYELKVVSLERDTFGEVIRSRPISAGHCLTSVQFSPGSDMILLSYGRKHRYLVRELVSQGQTIGEIHTLLEVYRASDLALVRVLHSVEDEANTACFHPFAGEGILYGTKGGKLRILRHTQAHMANADHGDVYRFEDELLKVDELADSTALGIEAGGG